MSVPLASSGVFLVFSSTRALVMDPGAWDAHAQRFFRTRLLGTPEGTVRVEPKGEAQGDRVVTWRDAEAGDYALAEEGERRAGGGGLAGLARRCPAVWVVERTSRDDRLALRLAMILASVHLGPIVDPDGPELFGVKTARAKLDAELAQ
ncbi:MAG TPA: hypothetical protein VIY73_29315 [Polyangiaceae bacterium]